MQLTRDTAFLSSFSSGKLRKNAKAKITRLLELADALTLETQSRDVDGSFDANPSQNYDKANFWAWYESAYSNLVIYLTVRDGVLVKATFADGPYHFCNELVMQFGSSVEDSEREVEPAEPAEPAEAPHSRKVVSLGDYQDRQDAKRDRLETRAHKAQAASNQFYQASKARADMIPFGQPILVGHHSEGRARRDAERIYRDMGKSVAAQEKADHYQSRANRVGTAGIASDDADAVQKLKDKLAQLERLQATMKAANKVIRKNLSDAQKIDILVTTHGLSQAQAKAILTPDFCGRTGFASYQLSNNNATIRSTKARLKQLEKLHNEAPLSGDGEIDGIEWTLSEEDGRIKFSFDTIPPEETRQFLYGHGFRFSRHREAWVRKLTPNAVRVTHYIVDKLNAQ